MVGHWSRLPGKFISKHGIPIPSDWISVTPCYQFTGTVREWYEKLVDETYSVIDEITLNMFSPVHEVHVYAHPDIELIYETSLRMKIFGGRHIEEEGRRMFRVYADEAQPRDIVSVRVLDPRGFIVGLGEIKIHDVDVTCQ